MEKKIVKLNRSAERFAALAEKSYADGDYIAALSFSRKELEFGKEYSAYMRIADCYENLGLNAYALKWLFGALDMAEPEELPDLYEGLAVNYLSLNEEAASAYYYNLLLGVDDTLTAENKREIAAAFAKNGKEKLRFVWPPELADYSEEMERGSKALKNGDLRKAIAELDKVKKGSKDYADAKQMQAVAHLLDGETEIAERLCEDVLRQQPNDIQTRATLAAVYLEQDKKKESEALARELALVKTDSTDELYKIATVCCENGLDAEAYEKFVELEKRMPCDGKMLYFKAVAAYRSGKIEQAESTFYKMYSLYPDASVVAYYLRRVRKELAGGERGEPLQYFYRVPQEERAARCQTLMEISNANEEDLELMRGDGIVRETLEWCFDELDGMDEELQYAAIVVAARLGEDDFLREKLLDQEISDMLKLEIVRMLLERNEDDRVGLVLCNVYRRLGIYKISIKRKKKKKFVGAYAQVASKFAVISPAHGRKLKAAAERLYRVLDELDMLELADSEEDIACAIYLISGLHEAGRDATKLAAAFEANEATVRLLVTCAEEYTEV